VLPHPLSGIGIFVAVLAGLGAGIVNGIAGGGSLVSFPVLLLLGYPALVANVTSTVGIWPGYLGGSVGFRGEIHVLRDRLYELAPTVVVGAACGGVLLLTTPSADFRLLAPWLVIFASVLFATQPLLARTLRLNRDKMSRSHRVSMHVAIFFAAIYGAYFGAGLGVVLLGVLGLWLSDPLVRVNGLRSMLALLINTVAVIVFVIKAPIAWKPAAAMLISSLVGGYLGALVARRVPTWLLRSIVVLAGLTTGVMLLVT
jgi:uncharacterized membrane protein YfcA